MGTYFRYICGLSRIEYELYGRDYRRHADRGDLPADYGPADAAAKTMLISPSPWPSPKGEGRGEGKRISQNQH